MDKEKFSNRQKSAILIMALDARSPGMSQKLFEKMGESQSKLLLHEINHLGKINTSDINTIIEEFHSLAITQDNLLGGKNLTDKLLKDSFGIDDSDGYFTTKNGLLDFTSNLEEKTLLEFLKQETDQVTALILSLLPDEQSASLLTHFSVEKTATLSNRMLSLDIPNFAILWKFHRELEMHLIGDNTEAIQESQQIFKLSRVLEMMVSERRDVVMEMIKKQDKASADKLEKLIFSFADLIFMPPKDLGIVLVEIDPLLTLAQAMQNISNDLHQKIMDAISERLKARLEEAISQAENTPEETIETAQTTIIQLCRNLESEQKIEPLTAIIEQKQELVTNMDSPTVTAEQTTATSSTGETN